MSTLQRRIYRAVISLHPADFRNQFGRDMARDFDDALGQRGFTPLLGDAMLSLARQWKARALTGPELDPVLAQSAPGHPFLAGQYVMVDEGSSLTAFDLASASVLSILLILTIGVAASIPNRHAIADLQSARVSHDGGIDTGHNGPPLAANDSRREHPGVDPLRTAAGLGVGPQHGPAYLVRSFAPPGFGPRATGGPPARPITLAHALVQLTLISIIIWITSFFLRRSPGVTRKAALGALGLLGLAASVAFGQAPVPPTHAQILHATAPLPSFEVATIKPWKPITMPMPVPVQVGMPDSRPAGPPRKIDPMGGGRAAGQRADRVHIIGQAAILLQSAFNLPLDSRNQIVGAPGWVNSETDRYEVQAKIDDSLFAAMRTMTPAQQREQVALMEQSLLADRFKLKVHFETRDLPAFALVVAKGGSKLTPAKEGESPQLSSSSDETTGTAVTLDDFAHSPLLRPDGRIVINQTGLKGAYDFTIKGEPGPDPPSFFTLIEEQLGLKLVPTKTSVEVIVIDSIERPTEN